MVEPRKLHRFDQYAGSLIVGALSLALLVANSPYAHVYELVHHTPVHFRFGPLIIDRPLVDWINEGLMALFFLLVGLELKRQFLEEHHATFKVAILPAISAIGGMIVPAAIYGAITWREPELMRGWGIPTATDIALALGALSLLGTRVPVQIKVFLTALAIFDDIGAVLIVGVFYGNGLLMTPLIVAALAVLLLALLNMAGITRAVPYVLVGIMLWVSMLQSELQPALAGVLIGLAVPLHAKVGGRRLSPLRRTEYRMHPWVVLLIVPLFAFFNAGIEIDLAAFDLSALRVSLGIVLGLFLGKQVGIMGFAWLAVRFNAAELPPETNWSQLYAAALLAGVGFTMSLFVATLAFSDPALLASAKLAILVASILSAVAGLIWAHHSMNAN